MRAYNHLFVSWDKFSDFIEDSGLDRTAALLVRIHTSIHTALQTQQLAREIKGVLPNALIIGCSTTNVICEGQIVSGCLISVAEFGNCTMKMGVFSCLSEDTGEKDGEELSREMTEGLVQGAEGLMLVFFPLNYHRTAKFVEGMNRAGRGLKMLGGAACMRAELTAENGNTAFVIADTEVSDTDAAAVVISSPGMFLYENAICGAESVGRSYEVTGVHDYYLDEIEGMDSAAWYEEQLGREELEKDPLLAGIFPLISEKTQLAYNVIYEPCSAQDGLQPGERKSRISMYTEIPAGTRFSLGYFDPAKIVDQLNTVYKEMKDAPIEAVFAYDCLAREWMLHDCAKWEIGQFHTTNMSGAMLAGEISNVSGQNIYANSTFVLAGVSESKDARILLKGSGLKGVSALQHNNVQMINYLLQAGNRQLSRKLAEQQNKMQKAMFYHEVLGLDNQTRYLFDRENMKLDKIAVFFLKNARLIKLFTGQTAFYEELRSIYGDIIKKLSDRRLHYYSYEEDSLMIAAEDGVEDEDFVDRMRQVYEALNGICRREFVFSYACAVVMHEEDMRQKVETTLQYCANNRIQFMLHSDIPKEVLTAKEEMHMLQILRDALVQDRVVPYFQGIHDNRRQKIVRYEALIRIQDAQGNIYYPNQFLPIAKEYNLYETLSIVMVKKTMEMFLYKDVKVSINLSVQDIYDRDMIKMIFKYLEKAEHPENFVFELVESEGVRDYQFIKQFADSVHELGAGIAIDDFGSGFSNLMHIIRIDADIIKIDGSIVKEICHDEKCREFAEMITGWCSRQGKEVVAEFVENREIQDRIEEIGVAYSQGYLFAKPRPWAACEKA